MAIETFFKIPPKEKPKDLGESNPKVKQTEHEHILLDVIITSTLEPKVTIAYKNTKTNKIFLSKPAEKTQVPILSNAPLFWLIPIKSYINENSIDILAVNFEEKKGITRFSSGNHICSSFILPEKQFDTLNTFNKFFEEFQLDKDDRNLVIKEVIKSSLNYDHHIPWKYLDVLPDPSDKNLFTIELKKRKSANTLKKTTVPAIPNSPTPNPTDAQSSQPPEDLNKENPLVLPISINTASMEIDNQLPNLDPQSDACTNNLPNTDPQSKEMQATNAPPHDQTPNNWADEVNLHQTPDSTISNNDTQANNSDVSNDSPNSDIRNSSLINEQEKIIEWCNNLELIERKADDVVKFFIDLSNDKIGPINHHPEAIFAKFKYKDRAFFRYFTSAEILKPLHQKEYEHIEKQYHVNYLKHHDLNFINHSTKIKIRNLINKALAIAFIRAGHCKSYKYSQIAAHLDYTFNYLIDPSKPKISRDDLFSSCEKALYDSLPPYLIAPTIFLLTSKLNFQWLCLSLIPKMSALWPEH